MWRTQVMRAPWATMAAPDTSDPLLWIGRGDVATGAGQRATRARGGRPVVGADHVVDEPGEAVEDVDRDGVAAATLPGSAR